VSESKYEAQIKHIESKYTQFKINMKPEIMKQFKAKCAELETTPTTEVKKFIESFIGE